MVWNKIFDGKGDNAYESVVTMDGGVIATGRGNYNMIFIKESDANNL